MNHELLDVQAGFKKGRGIRDQISNILCQQPLHFSISQKYYRKFWPKFPPINSPEVGELAPSLLSSDPFPASPAQLCRGADPCLCLPGFWGF